ncbi:MAG: 30S ribosomal protein S8 [Candidatus Marinimicrobia bacterium]|nr:30S ribosomal protein S8 [Candidatus Neomarinimicrobiota bacterium]
MSVSDPIADMLTRLRNGLAAGQETVLVPRSKLKRDLAEILRREGLILSCEEEDGQMPPMLRLRLKYVGGESVIRGLRRISRPGLRRYVPAAEVPRVLRGSGLAILTTSAGLMTDSEARRRHLGGEVLCYVW